jgi:hypothetical protein
MKKIVGALIIVAVGIILYTIRPIPFDKDLFKSNEVHITYVNNSVDNGTPKIDFINFDFTIKDSEYQKLQEILEKYSYHSCFKSIKDEGVENGGNPFLITYGMESIMIHNVPDLFIEGDVYHVGYWGDSKINKLYDELMTLLNLSE